MIAGDWDWRGAIQKRFRWSRLRFEWGWFYYKTNCYGDTLDWCWVWESDKQ